MVRECQIRDGKSAEVWVHLQGAGTFTGNTLTANVGGVGCRSHVTKRDGEEWAPSELVISPSHIGYSVGVTTEHLAITSGFVSRFPKALPN